MPERGKTVYRHRLAFAIQPGSWAAYALAIGLSLVALSIRAAIGLVDPAAAAYPSFLAAVLLSAIIAGVSAGILAATLGLLLGYVFFSASVPNAYAPGSLVLYGVSSIAIIWIAEHYRHLLRRLQSKEQLSERHLALMQAENEVMAQIVSEGDLAATLSNLTRTIETYMEAPTFASVMLVESGRLRVGAAPALPEAYSRALEGLEVGPAAGSCGTAAFRNATVVVSDISTDALWASYRQLALPHGLRACWSVPIVSTGNVVIGTFAVYHPEPRVPTAEEKEIVGLLTRIAALAIEQERGREQHRRSHEIAQRLAAIISSSDDAIISKNLNGIVTSWNQSAERLFGYTPEEMIGKSITLLIPEDRLYEEEDILARIVTGQRVQHFETVRRRKDGGLLDISLTISPIKDSRDNIVGASKIARDISERKQREAQIRTLAREAEHRAKNILATVLATVRLTYAETPQALKAAIEGRIQALANVNRLFVESNWAGAELRDVVSQELAPYRRGEGPPLHINGQNIMLEPNAAQIMAVCVHELATNAAKYGALSRPEGQVQTQWSREADGRLIFRWAEMNGPPIIGPPARRGFGMKVIERMIQPKGSAEFQWQAGGLVCEISLAA
jgi:PAS domain S-box-containing protein